MIGEGMVSPPGEDRISSGGHLWDGAREIKLLGLPARMMLKVHSTRMDGWEKLSCTSQGSYKEVEIVFRQKHLLEHDILTSAYCSLLGRRGRKVKTSPGTFKIELGISL